MYDARIKSIRVKCGGNKCRSRRRRRRRREFRNSQEGIRVKRRRVLDVLCVYSIYNIFFCQRRARKVDDKSTYQH